MGDSYVSDSKGHIIVPDDNDIMQRKREWGEEGVDASKEMTILPSTSCDDSESSSRSMEEEECHHAIMTASQEDSINENDMQLCSALEETKSETTATPDASLARNSEEELLETQQTESATEAEEDAMDAENEAFMESLRKTSVAVAGGTLVGVGVVLAPFPDPFGEIMAAAGVGMLATEFPFAKRIMDGAKHRLVNMIDSLQQEDGQQEENMDEGSGCNEHHCGGVAATATNRVDEATKAMRQHAQKLGAQIRPLIVPGDDETTASLEQAGNVGGSAMSDTLLS